MRSPRRFEKLKGLRGGADLLPLLPWDIPFLLWIAEISAINLLIVTVNLGGKVREAL